MIGSCLNYYIAYLRIENGKLVTRLYAKTDDSNFAIVTFPLLSSSILSAPANGVYILASLFC